MITSRTWRSSFDAFNKQTFTDFELIIAEDNNDPETEPFLQIQKETILLSHTSRKPGRKNWLSQDHHA